MDFEGAVVDLDGTVYRGETLLPGAAAAVEHLREAGVWTVFFSNNPVLSRTEYAERLTDLGIEVGPEAVLSSGTVTARFLADEHADDDVFVVGAEGLRRQLRAAGVRLVDDATAADVLVVSWDRGFGYGDMLAGYRALASGAAFYGTDPDRLIPAEEGMVPGSGAIVNAIGGVVEREPDRVLGKPSPEAQRAVLEVLGVPADRCVLVGDRLETDVQLGENAGMTTVLVRTGASTDADVAASDVAPDHVIDSLADLPSVLS